MPRRKAEANNDDAAESSPAKVAKINDPAAKPVSAATPKRKGRPPLSAEEKSKRLKAQAERPARGRGRPKGSIKRGRGRPPLSKEEKSNSVKAKVQSSGRGRGRPKGSTKSPAKKGAQTK